MFKKVLAAFVTLTIMFSPVGGALVQDGANVASAKGYKSGKRSFDSGNSNQPSLFKNNNNSNTNSNSSVNKQNATKKSASSSTATKSKRGGLMKGLLFGGLAGLMFGSLLGNLGALGAVIGFFINTLVIVALILLVVKLFQSVKRNKRKEQEVNSWRH
ncbi:hypothetical protein FZC66_09880 [Priestia megaterium]|nr:hypothetical protein FZC66_09880 [Priestia megaterium]